MFIHRTRGQNTWITWNRWQNSFFNMILIQNRSRGKEILTRYITRVFSWLVCVNSA